MKKAVLSKLFTTLSVILGICAVSFLILLLFGIRPFILKSNSMEPLYPEGSLVFINTKIQPEEVNIGDVLVYRQDSTLVMHRLIAVDTFKGDSSDMQEHVELSRINLVGRPVFHIAYAGIFADLVRKVPWVFFMIAAILFVIACLPNKTTTSPEDLSPESARSEGDFF